MALNKGIWDPKPRVTSIKGRNLQSLMQSNEGRSELKARKLASPVLKVVFSSGIRV